MYLVSKLPHVIQFCTKICTMVHWISVGTNSSYVAAGILNIQYCTKVSVWAVLCGVIGGFDVRRGPAAARNGRGHSPPGGVSRPRVTDRGRKVINPDVIQYVMFVTYLVPRHWPFQSS